MHSLINAFRFYTNLDGQFDINKSFYIFSVITISSFGSITIIYYDAFIEIFLYAKWFLFAIFLFLQLKIYNKFYYMLSFTVALVLSFLIGYSEILIFDAFNKLFHEHKSMSLLILYMLIFVSMAMGIIVLAGIYGARKATPGQRLRSAVKVAGAGLIVMSLFALPFGLAAIMIAS